MYPFEIRMRARGLRRKGYTFNEILEKLPFLSKSTVSDWVRGIELSPAQQERILKKQLRGRVELMRYNRERHQEAIKRAQKVISEAKEEINKLNERDLLIAGSALYWAEGTKRKGGLIEFTNSDPKMVSLMMKFFREVCKVSEGRFKCRLFLHPGVNKRKARQFWSKVTGVPPSQFTKPYVKPPKSSSGKMHNILYRGTCQIRVGDVQTFHKIQGFIKGLTVEDKQENS